MKNSTLNQIESEIKAFQPLDFTVLDNLKKKTKKSNRFITCSICGKTITKNSMVRHFFTFHSSDEAI